MDEEEYVAAQEKKFILKQFTLKPTENKKEKTIDDVYGYDAETFKDLKTDNQEVYGICLYNEDPIKQKQFYGADTIKLFCDYMDEIKTEVDTSKTHQTKKIGYIMMYGFNSSRFDNLLIFNELHNRLPGLKYIIAGNQIKYIKYHNIIMIDVNLYYAGSLSSVAESF